MQVEKLFETIDSDFYTGVPDSQLKPLCDYLMHKYSINPKHHIIAANEGNCAAVAAGYYLATQKIPVVYMQNSGEGNIINPVASLMNDKVYGIPCIFIIGWRGEPGIKDEPQHVYQGEITIKLLEDIGIESYIIDANTTQNELETQMKKFSLLLELGKQVAFVIKKGALSFDEKIEYKNNYGMLREDIIRKIVSKTGTDIIVSTTGKASRELFEIRESNGQSHNYDFLTVGSMGHSSSIALGIASQKPKRKIWIIDGDGSALMHMGSMAVLGANSPDNIVHIVINNESHETVGGMPTVSGQINFVEIAKACGYSSATCAYDEETLNVVLEDAKNNIGLSFIEIKCAIGARANLGRPTTSTKENKTTFMNELIN